MLAVDWMMHPALTPTALVDSVVTVSKILPSVGFGSHNKRIVNVEAASDAVIFSHVVLRLLTTHIDIISVNQYRLKMTYLV